MAVLERTARILTGVNGGYGILFLLLSTAPVLEAFTNKTSLGAHVQGTVPNQRYQ